MSVYSIVSKIPKNYFTEGADISMKAVEKMGFYSHYLNSGSFCRHYYHGTDEDPSLRIESSAIINLRGVSTKLDKYKD